MKAYLPAEGLEISAHIRCHLHLRASKNESEKDGEGYPERWKR